MSCRRGILLRHQTYLIQRSARTGTRTAEGGTAQRRSAAYRHGVFKWRIFELVAW